MAPHLSICCFSGKPTSSINNRPDQNLLDEFVNVITQPEVMVLVLLAVSAVAFYIIITRVRGKRVASNAAPSTQASAAKNIDLYDHLQYF